MFSKFVFIIKRAESYPNYFGAIYSFFIFASKRIDKPRTYRIITCNRDISSKENTYNTAITFNQRTVYQANKRHDNGVNISKQVINLADKVEVMPICTITKLDKRRCFNSKFLKKCLILLNMTDKIMR